MEVCALFGLLLVAAIGASGVVLLATLLRLSVFGHSWRRGYRLAAAHTFILLAFMAYAPVDIRRNWGSPYGDLYAWYILVPGIHIYYPSNLLFHDAVFHWLLGYMESFPASVLCVVVGPGLVGLVVGGLQWLAVGAAWDRLARRFPILTDEQDAGKIDLEASGPKDGPG